MAKFWNKKVLYMLLVFLLAFSLAACGGQDTVEPVDDDPYVEDPVETDTSLADYNGWWYLDLDYTDLDIPFEAFYLDGAEGTFMPSDLYGNELNTGYASMDENGNIILSVDSLGDVLLQPEGNVMYDEYGAVVFVAGDGPNAMNLGDLSGRWYQNGDYNGDYYELTGDTCKRVMANGAELDEESYSISSMNIQYQVGAAIDVTQMTFGDDVLSKSAEFSPGFELFVLTDYGTTTIFVRDSAIGTSEGDAAMARYALINNDWRALDNSYVLSFYPNGAYECFSDGGQQRFGEGSWTLNDGYFYITWADDGTKEACDFDGNIIYVPSLGVKISNGQGSANDWFGNYYGEMGDVYIKESTVENAINAIFSADDEYGSITESLLRLGADGNSAADEYFQVYLENGVLTVESLHPSFDNHAGTYEKQ